MKVLTITGDLLANVGLEDFPDPLEQIRNVPIRIG